ncbi:Chitinase 2 [Phlyctochytrium bullatum]|nr:Chitinase 2 [Phlyctochytrium bullatum]
MVKIASILSVIAAGASFVAALPAPSLENYYGVPPPPAVSSPKVPSTVTSTPVATVPATTPPVSTSTKKKCSKRTKSTATGTSTKSVPATSTTSTKVVPVTPTGTTTPCDESTKSVPATKTTSTKVVPVVPTSTTTPCDDKTKSVPATTSTKVVPVVPTSTTTPCDDKTKSVPATSSTKVVPVETGYGAPDQPPKPSSKATATATTPCDESSTKAPASPTVTYGGNGGNTSGKATSTPCTTSTAAATSTPCTTSTSGVPLPTTTATGVNPGPETKATSTVTATTTSTSTVIPGTPTTTASSSSTSTTTTSPPNTTTTSSSATTTTTSSSSSSSSSSTATTTTSSTVVSKPTPPANIFAYYGQNQAYEATKEKPEAQRVWQRSIGEYCSDANAGTLYVSFLNTFTADLDKETFAYTINMANIAAYEATATGVNFNGVWGVDAVAAGIKVCKEKGVKVHLAIGGGEGTSVKFVGKGTAAQKGEFAGKVLAHLFFGIGEQPAKNLIGAAKPFGDVVFDGFDLDLERDFDGANSDESEKAIIAMSSYLADNKVEIIATPQCFDSVGAANGLDANLGKIMKGLGSKLSAIQVQFYNNEPCKVDAPGFNYKTWVDAFPGIPIRVAVLGNQNVGTKKFPNGFVPSVKTLVDIVSTKLNTLGGAYKNAFGGYAVWDVSAATDVTKDTASGDNYLAALKKLVGAAPART